MEVLKIAQALGPDRRNNLASNASRTPSATSSSCSASDRPLRGAGGVSTRTTTTQSPVTVPNSITPSLPAICTSPACRPNYPVFRTGFLGYKHRGMHRRHAISPVFFGHY